MQPNQNNLFDTKALVIMLLAGGFLFGWQHYIAKKYPNQDLNKTVQQVPPVQAENKNDLALNTQPILNDDNKNLVSNSSEVIYNYSDDQVSFEVTNFGMGLKSFSLKKFFTENKMENINFNATSINKLFETRFTHDFEKMIFNVEEKKPGHFVGVFELNGMKIIRELIYKPGTFSFENKLTFENPNEKLKNGFSIFLPEQIYVSKTSNFLMPSFHFQDFHFYSQASSQTVNYGTVSESYEKDFENVNLMSVGSQYFAIGFLDKSNILPRAKIKADVGAKLATAEMVYNPAQLNQNLYFSQIFFVGPKSSDLLSIIDTEFPKLIDYGYFSFIAKPLVSIMKWSYSILGNWGLAIVLLTLIVRFLVLPFNFMAIRSMKAMKKIQPDIQKLKEKYKDDAMALNKEMMDLMKKNGANPLGGCLPMLLQIPVFFALYKVVGNTVELYQAPFFGWINDLSSPDSFFVLPILMGLTMYLQQKMTPTTMDPTQEKVMAFLPLIFSVFMISTPSGLTLYMFISGLFGIIQQYVLTNDKMSLRR